nr:zinc transporter [Raoultella sp. NCTC 9187]
MRRYMAPQRDAYSRLASERLPWMNDDQRRRMQDISDRLGRGLDEIDSCIARTAIMSDEMRKLCRSDVAQNLYHVADGNGLSAQYLSDRPVWRQPRRIPGNEWHLGFSIFCVMLVVLIAVLRGGYIAVNGCK